ncbi:MAG: hypothetical protein IPI27_19120 [Betaproteobacteria bacterium]|nr:hypothetical protein [Betaproteobacteria bacterium]
MQDAAVERAVEVGLGAPAVVGAEEFQRGEARHQLHHRRRVERQVGLVGEQRPRGADLLHDQRDAGHRHLRLDEAAHDRAGQRGLHRTGRQRDDQQRQRRRRRAQCLLETAPGGHRVSHAASRIPATRVASSSNSASVTM